MSPAQTLGRFIDGSLVESFSGYIYIYPESQRLWKEYIGDLKRIFLYFTIDYVRKIIVFGLLSGRFCI